MAGVETVTSVFNGPTGAPLAVRTYRRAPTTNALPIVVYAHGGGFVTGNLDTDHAHCVELARATDCLIVSVDYRLAPENPCPAALSMTCRPRSTTQCSTLGSSMPTPPASP
jgi:acetyl esterase/lipase